MPSQTLSFLGRRFEIYDLSQRLSNQTSAFEPNPHEIAYTTHEESAASERFEIPAAAWPGGEAWALETVTLTTHSGTHVDAPYHYAARTAAGAPARTIDQLPFRWVMGEAFLLDMTEIDPRKGIVEGDVRAGLERIGYQPKPDDIALIRTDISKRFGEAGYEQLHPGLRRDATTYLVERGVKLIGIDAWGIDRPMEIMAAEVREGDLSQLWESHKYGAEHEYAQIEKLCNLDSIPRDHGFHVLALPILIEGASAGWARVVAMVEVEGA